MAPTAKATLPAKSQQEVFVELLSVPQELCEPAGLGLSDRGGQAPFGGIQGNPVVKSTVLDEDTFCFLHSEVA